MSASGRIAGAIAPLWRASRKAVITVTGASVLFVGIAMLVLPGPAFVVIPAGLAILGFEFAWARRALRHVQEHGERTLGSWRRTALSPLPAAPRQEQRPTGGRQPSPQGTRGVF